MRNLAKHSWTSNFRKKQRGKRRKAKGAWHHRTPTCILYELIMTIFVTNDAWSSWKYSRGNDTLTRHKLTSKRNVNIDGKSHLKNGDGGGGKPTNVRENRFQFCSRDSWTNETRLYVQRHVCAPKFPLSIRSKRLATWKW